MTVPGTASLALEPKGEMFSRSYAARHSSPGRSRLPERAAVQGWSAPHGTLQLQRQNIEHEIGHDDEGYKREHVASGHRCK